jgi:hypothetical protein
MFKLLPLLCSLLAVHCASAHDCAQERERYNRTFEELLGEAPAFRETVLRLQPFSKLFPDCEDTCRTLWTNVRDAVPATCNANCWAAVEKTFLRKHGECAGVVEESCVRRLPQDCNETCRSAFVEDNGDCRDMFEGTCYDKHALFGGETDEFLAAFPECAECTMKRSGAWAMFSRGSKDAGASAFETAFVKEFPECGGRKQRGLQLSTQLSFPKRRRLANQRYANLCNIASSGEFTFDRNCSITQTITVNGVLKITGVVGADGAKPAIDGGWDEVQGSGTGVRLFLIDSGGTLMIDNMILTHGEVRFQFKREGDIEARDRLTQLSFFL